MKNEDQVLKILTQIEQKSILKAKENLERAKNLDPSIHIMKTHFPELNVYVTLEKTYTTCLGYAIQEIAELAGDEVKNVDKVNKTIGIDLNVRQIYEGQLKSNYNTQTGTHVRDSIKKLIDTTSNNKTTPFFAVAFGKSYNYTKNDILYLGGKCFWDWIGVDYYEINDMIIESILRLRKLSDDNFSQLI
jgi:hypothetical protein